MTVLIIGGSGLLGTELVRQAAPSDGPPAATYRSRPDAAGVFHLAGPDALSRHRLGELIARRDGLDPARLPSARRSDTGLPGGIDVRLDCRATQRKLDTRLRGARAFLRAGDPA
ncbi:hypothetical protein ACIQZN_09460 [Streptomyces sp. NPDC097595]|uniref:hypothetical protein n=1 Tax=Streptomyces sp. NPDC097595 TaxID=3366090 RepID=UPI0038173D59